MKKITVTLISGIVYVFLTSLLAYAGGPLNISEWKALIMSENEKERVLAKQMILDGKEALVQNKELIQELISIVRRPVIEGEEFYNLTTSRNIAIFLLGKLRAKEAVPDLIEWLTPREGQNLTIDALMVFAPAGYALVEIGLPSVPPLMEKLKSEGTSILGKECVKVITRIKGLEETELLLQRTLGEETDPVKETNLRAALELIESPDSVLYALDNVFKKASAEVVKE